jgi:hypothetical protein
MSLEAVTPKGFRALFVLMFLHVQRRRVVVTLNPVSTIPAADGTPQCLSPGRIVRERLTAGTSWAKAARKPPIWVILQIIDYVKPRPSGRDLCATSSLVGRVSPNNA